ncbi:MAG: ABC transporter permease [Paracoccaceae bacterium]|nr:ABC transporter permease [Paracoccaceae bacterium]MDG1940070.1 ABC transporter permease [Paracoccaceae bacterium]|tara:strand:+ start:2014 stop:2877 length:864 start_codon:yes stop_codon:yes gene_type:complete
MNSENHDWKSFLLDLVSDLTPGAFVSILFLIFVILIGLFAPWLAPFDQGEILTNESFEPPSSMLWLGSDFLGRDLLSRLISGVRVTLFLALMITFLSFFLGVGLGFLAAAFGGKVDATISRINDALLSFPSLMLALIVINSLGSSFVVLVITIAFIDMTRVFRVARALAVNIMVMDYVEAAIVRGEGKVWIILHEVLPNSLTPLAAEFGIRFTYAILFISALSFLGLGVQPPQSDLGVLVKENMQALLYGEYTNIYPAVTIAAIAISMNVFVDWLLKKSSAKLSEEI